MTRIILIFNIILIIFQFKNDLILGSPITETMMNRLNVTGCPRIVTREEWKARKPLGEQQIERTPTPYVVIHHGGIRQYCYDQETCSKIVRSYQRLHIDDHGWFDLGYNFVIGEDGNIYEGRGWNKVGAHAPGYNFQSIGICIIGDFMDFLPNALALRALNSLISCGVFLGKIHHDYNVIGHRQARNTLCPGDTFYKYVMTFPHWTSQPIPEKVQTTTTDAPSKAAKESYYYLSMCKGHGHECMCSTTEKTIKVIIMVRATFLFIATCITICHPAEIANSAATSEIPNIISRQQWGARSPKTTTRPLRINPPPYVIIHHSDTVSCNTQAICQARVRSFQNYHMDTKKWNDIGYNFLVGEDGNVYEGLGWGKHGSHSIPYNSKSIGICIIGNFTNTTPNPASIRTTKNLIAYGVANNKIKSDYKLLGHRQTAQTDCPGNSLYNMIKTWNNWSDMP
ncbi:peptidoglycan recognition protein 3-like [Vespa crabro]|uniref:peptidoglycan recognition protein 3-like n=1 Tax=Vespa crabro TaxID=7445 RepID=UPI001F031E91|nr:peptidoglycan recognition protein 3-like [Vespa crabro]